MSPPSSSSSSSSPSFPLSSLSVVFSVSNPNFTEAEYLRNDLWFGKTEGLCLVGVVDGSRVSRNSFLLVRGASEGGGLNANEILLVIKGGCRAIRGSIRLKR